MPTKKFLFLYSELAGYFLACLKELSNLPNTEIRLVHWPINKEAPFELNISGSIKSYEKSSLSSKELLKMTEEFKPDLVFCPGWMDKEYFGLVKALKGTAVILGGMDNKYSSKLKQIIARFVAPIKITPHFDFLFVPGPEQAKYAKLLGFKDSQIVQGYYSADLELFNEIYTDSKNQKEQAFPHRFIYTGRYYEFKGLNELWETFSELKEEMQNDWELWCLGTGDLKPINYSAIKHFGFVQPADLKEYLIQSGVFVLPSHKEPWAVAVHEFAAAGFPLICSSEVGAASVFLEEGKNGFSFAAKSKSELKTALKKVMQMRDEDLVGMMKNSHEIAQQISPSKWAANVSNLVQNVRN